MINRILEGVGEGEVERDGTGMIFIFHTRTRPFPTDPALLMIF